jgi:predicted PurR-regulated permease PerM
MASVEPQIPGDAQATGRWIELVIRLSVLALLLYLSLTLIRPFLTIVIWSVVLVVALYPLYEWMTDLLGGRRRLAAILLTLVCLLVVIGPAAWLVFSLLDSIGALSQRLDLSRFVLPEPHESVKAWPLIGEQVFQFWHLATNNLSAAFAKIAPHLKPLGSSLIIIATGAGAGAVKFLIAIIVAGFLYPPAPAMVNSIIGFARKLDAGRGEEFVRLASGTIRSVARGVVGISALQAFFAGVGFVTAGVPAASLLTSAVLVLGIIQIGPSIVIIPLIIWSWIALETTTALLFTLYMIPVSLLDNILRPLVMARGLDTPMLVILLGVIGGTISYGITGLFLGPIILAVIWALLTAWIKEDAPLQPV